MKCRRVPWLFSSKQCDIFFKLSPENLVVPTSCLRGCVKISKAYRNRAQSNKRVIYILKLNLITVCCFICVRLFVNFFFQEFLHPLGESEFLPGRILQKLLDIGFCGDKWSEKACYDIAEIVFGFDDSNSNMVSIKFKILNLLGNWDTWIQHRKYLYFF